MLQHRSLPYVGQILMWASSYPDSTSSWPHSRVTIEDQFQGVPGDEGEHILGGNCLELYGLAAKV